MKLKLQFFTINGNIKKSNYVSLGIWRLVSMENMDTILKAVGINPMTLEMVMKADAMITIYEDIDHQWKILQETSIIAKSLRGYRTRNFKMTANKFKLDVPKPEVVDDWDLRQVKIYINENREPNHILN